MQVIFAGKAHPHDIPGKEIIRELVHFSRKGRGSLAASSFLEDYDMTMFALHDLGLRRLAQHTPRRPLEASGTSGMKAGMNGVPQLFPSWTAGGAEGLQARAGLGDRPGRGIQGRTPSRTRSRATRSTTSSSARSLPTFYRRGRDNLPREWIAKMRESIKSIGRDFLQPPHA